MNDRCLLFCWFGWQASSKKLIFSTQVLVMLYIIFFFTIQHYSAKTTTNSVERPVNSTNANSNFKLITIKGYTLLFVWQANLNQSNNILNLIWIYQSKAEMILSPASTVGNHRGVNLIWRNWVSVRLLVLFLWSSVSPRDYLSLCLLVLRTDQWNQLLIISWNENNGRYLCITRDVEFW